MNYKQEQTKIQEQYRYDYTPLGTIHILNAQGEKLLGISTALVLPEDITLDHKGLLVIKEWDSRGYLVNEYKLGRYTHLDLAFSIATIITDTHMILWNNKNDRIPLLKNQS